MSPTCTGEHSLLMSSSWRGLALYRGGSKEWRWKICDFCNLSLFKQSSLKVSHLLHWTQLIVENRHFFLFLPLFIAAPCACRDGLSTQLEGLESSPSGETTEFWVMHDGWFLCHILKTWDYRRGGQPAFILPLIASGTTYSSLLIEVLLLQEFKKSLPGLCE